MDRATRVGKTTREDCPYPVDGEVTVSIPSSAIKGRSGGSVARPTFHGVLDLERNHIRIDCEEDHSFWLEIHLDEVPALSAAPGGDVCLRAREHFERVSARHDSAAGPVCPAP